MWSVAFEFWIFNYLGDSPMLNACNRFYVTPLKVLTLKNLPLFHLHSYSYRYNHFAFLWHVRLQDENESKTWCLNLSLKNSILEFEIKFGIKNLILEFEKSFWNFCLKASLRATPSFVDSSRSTFQTPSATSQAASPWRQQVAIFSFLCAKIEIFFTSSSLRLFLHLLERSRWSRILASSSSSGNETIGNMQEEEEEEENQNLPDQEEDE